MPDLSSFLASTLSSGPSEPPEPMSEFQRYDAVDLDVKFLLALLKEEHPLLESVCVPEFRMCTFSNSEVRWQSGRCPDRAVLDVKAGMIVYNGRTSSPEMHIPSELPYFIKDCGARFVACNLGLYAGTDVRVGHSNALLFDTRDRVVERYDPEGAPPNMKHVDHAIRDAFRKALPSYSYTGNIGDELGPQRWADAYDGLCATYSLMYVLLRVTNPEKTPKRIREMILEGKGPAKLRNEVLRLNKYVIEVLRRHDRGTLRRGSLSPSHLLNFWRRGASSRGRRRPLSLSRRRKRKRSRTFSAHST